MLLMSLMLLFGVSVFAQDAQPINPIDISKLPDVANKPDAFAQKGWKVEEVVKGDLNGDGKLDAAIKLAQIEDGREGGIGGDRTLVIAFGEGNGWKVTQTTLLFERTGIGAGGSMAGFPYPGPKGGMLGLRAGEAAAIEAPNATAKVVSLAELI